MIHTPHIVKSAVRIWRQLPGQTFSEIRTYCSPGADEPEEYSFDVVSSSSRYYLSWEQEDGENDELFFHWLSLRQRRHTSGTVEEAQTDPRVAKAIASRVLSVKLYGDLSIDAVFAASIQTNTTALIFATVWDPAPPGAFFGGNTLRSFLPRQFREATTAFELEEIATLNEQV